MSFSQCRITNFRVPSLASSSLHLCYFYFMNLFRLTKSLFRNYHNFFLLCRWTTSLPPQPPPPPQISIVGHPQPPPPPPQPPPPRISSIKSFTTSSSVVASAKIWGSKTTKCLCSPSATFPDDGKNTPAPCPHHLKHQNLLGLYLYLLRPLQ
jgi:hypothetical protein